MDVLFICSNQLLARRVALVHGNAMAMGRLSLFLTLMGPMSSVMAIAVVVFEFALPILVEYVRGRIR